MKKNKISISQLAKICNVSEGTVDRALHNRRGISPKTRELVMAAASKYGYRPNKTVNKKTAMVGIVVFDLYNEYFSELIVALEKELRKHGYYSLVMFSDKDKLTEIDCIEKLYNAGVDTIILCPINDGADFAEYLNSWKIPVVTLGNKVEGIKFVGADDYAAMNDMTERVIRKGVERIIYYSPALGYSDCNLYGQKRRADGFLNAVSKHNIQYSIATDIPENVTENTAIIASTDYYALRLMSGDIPKNCLIAGFDNIKGVKGSYMTVASERGLIAKEVAEYVLDASNNTDIFVEYKIIDCNKG